MTEIEIILSVDRDETPPSLEANGDEEEEMENQLSMPLNDYKEEVKPFSRALDDLYEERKPSFAMASRDGDDDTVMALENADAQEPCKNICTEMMTMGYFEEEGISKWNKRDRDENLTPPTKRWPLVVIDCDFSDQETKNSMKGKGLLRRARRGRLIGCPTSNRYKSRCVDVVFAEQDKFSTIYAVEVCSSSTPMLSDLYACQSLARF